MAKRPTGYATVRIVRDRGGKFFVVDGKGSPCTEPLDTKEEARRAAQSWRQWYQCERILSREFLKVLRATVPLFPLLDKQEIEHVADNALQSILERVKRGRAA